VRAITNEKLPIIFDNSAARGHSSSGDDFDLWTKAKGGREAGATLECMSLIQLSGLSRNKGRISSK
jgi:hypothetical protein